MEMHQNINANHVWLYHVHFIKFVANNDEFSKLFFPNCGMYTIYLNLLCCNSYTIYQPIEKLNEFYVIDINKMQIKYESC